MANTFSNSLMFNEWEKTANLFLVLNFFKVSANFFENTAYKDAIIHGFTGLTFYFFFNMNIPLQS